MCIMNICTGIYIEFLFVDNINFATTGIVQNDGIYIKKRFQSEQNQEDQV